MSRLLKRKVFKLSFSILSLLIVIFCLTSCGQNNVIDLGIPSNVKTIQEYDTHEGIHGDGEYYLAIEFTQQQLEDIKLQIKDKESWKSIPIDQNIESFLWGWEEIKANSVLTHYGKIKDIPKGIKNGVYYFRDRYAEIYPEYKNISLLDKRRHAHNFIFSILDFDTKILYIYKYDS